VKSTTTKKRGETDKGGLRLIREKLRMVSKEVREFKNIGRRLMRRQAAYGKSKEIRLLKKGAMAMANVPQGGSQS